MASHGKDVLVLLSSGLDSSVALSMAHQSNRVRMAITFDYGQRAAKRELEHSEKLARHFQIDHLLFQLPWFKEFRSSGLLNGGTLPRPTLDALSKRAESEESAKAVWVPNRNGVFIEIAAGIAEEKGISEIVVGFNREEAVTFPDNSKEYLATISKALYFSTKNCVKVTSPTVEMDKTQIVRHAKREGFPFELIWSCYESGEKMCGRCESCMRLKRAFHANEVDYERYFSDQSFD